MTKKKSKKDIKAERKMLVSVIEKAVRSEKENSLDDFPALVVANERRIKQLNLTPGVKLSQEGEWRWRGIKEHLGLQKKEITGFLQEVPISINEINYLRFVKTCWRGQITFLFWILLSL